jgi:hypothetical protein
MPAKCSFNSGEGKPNDHERTFAAGWVAARIPEASGNARGWPREGASRRSRRAPPRGDTSSGPESVARRGGGGASVPEHLAPVDENGRHRFAGDRS